MDEDFAYLFETVPDISSWRHEALCAHLGPYGWDAMLAPEQIALCRKCPAIQKCHQYAEDIHANRDVYGGTRWRDGKPVTEYSRTYRKGTPRNV